MLPYTQHVRLDVRLPVEPVLLPHVHLELPPVVRLLHRVHQTRKRRRVEVPLVQREELADLRRLRELPADPQHSAKRQVDIKAADADWSGLHRLVLRAVEEHVDDARGEDVKERGVDPVHDPVGAVREARVEMHVFAGVLHCVALRQLAEALPGDLVYLAARAVVHAHGVRSGSGGSVRGSVWARFAPVSGRVPGRCY